MVTQIITLTLALLFAALPQAGLAEATGVAPAAGMATTSVAQADARLAEVASARAGVEAQFAAREQRCSDKFFVNHCLDQAKDERRAALSRLRATEIEARHFKRLDAVKQRDLALADKNAATDAAADAATDAAAAAPPRPAPDIAAPPAPRIDPARRLAQQQAKEARQQAQHAAEAGKRAANVAAYEQKQRASEQRQREVAAKLAEKARAAKAATMP